ncbi:unnamed protein product [Polarella glacialis]|uniref:LicD/FKTN/FKRP nucleotidyltransferase domain-containing protein n=1 Tax=Polarella glacialis TaxID=89957 RepID=A0A813EA29_POLGL|nr:unnamed protein product [Polarella glacialis]
MRGPILGVVRHHGFLPWENDSDVCVPVEFAQELIILALLGLQGLDLPEACLQDQRCQELAEAAARLRSVGVRLLGTWIVEKNMEKFIFFAEEDAAAVMNNSRRVEDPVIDVYLCKGWPGLSGESELDESGILIPHEVIFPLQRTYFSGLSSWAYRKRRQVMDERYGMDWPVECRAPNWREKGRRHGLWPFSVPCEALYGHHSFAREVSVSQAPHVAGLGIRMLAWLCAAMRSTDHVADAADRQARPVVSCLQKESLTQTPTAADSLGLTSQVCTAHVRVPRTPGGNGSTSAAPPEQLVGGEASWWELREASALMAPSLQRGRGSSFTFLETGVQRGGGGGGEAPARPGDGDGQEVALHYLLDLALHPSPDLLCEVIVRLWPVVPAAQPGVAEQTWLGPPPRRRRTVVIAEGGMPSLGSSEVFLEVFSCVCWRTPLLTVSSPAWDLHELDSDLVAEAAMAAFGSAGT